MIRRPFGSDFLLICQHDHALLAGELAAHVGNALFAPPAPLGPVMTAISQHDCGWQAVDEHPRLDDQGLPRHVFQSRVDDVLPAWTDSVDRVAKTDPYAGLLVSLHAMSLAGIVMHRHGTPPSQLSRHDEFRLSQFLHRQIEIQETLRKKLQMRVDLPLRGGLAEPGRSPDEDLLLANFHLMQLLDQLSLVLCFDELLFARVNNVYPRPGAEALTVGFDCESQCVRLDPWPFDVEQLDLSIPGRRVPNRPYAGENDLVDTLAHAPSQTIPLRVRI